MQNGTTGRRTTRVQDLCSVAAFRENAADLMGMSVFPTHPIIHGKHRACLAPILRISPISPIGLIGPISARNTPKLPNEPKRKPPNPNEINLSGPAAASPAPKQTQIADGLRTRSQNLSQRPVDRHFGCGVSRAVFFCEAGVRLSRFTLHASTRQPFHPKMPAKHRKTTTHKNMKKILGRLHGIQPTGKLGSMTVPGRPVKASQSQSNLVKVGFDWLLSAFPFSTSACTFHRPPSLVAAPAALCLCVEIRCFRAPNPAPTACFHYRVISLI